MAVAFLNSYPADYSVSGSAAFGVADVQANIGDTILHTVQYSDANVANNISAAPTWNGQTMVSTGARVNRFLWVQTWKVIALSTATAPVLCPTDGGGVFLGVACARTYSGATSVATIVQQISVDPYANPSLDSPSLAAGDLIDETLNASGFDGGFGNVTATTWTEANTQTRRATIATTATSVGTMVLSTKSGTGALTCGYTPNADEPVYVHSLLHLIAGEPTPTIDTVTTDGDSGFVVGEPFTYTKTGLGTVTGFTVKTGATPAAITSAINLTPGAGELKYWEDGQYYPFAGTVIAEGSDGTLTGSGSFTLSIPPDQVSVVFNTVETTDNTYLGNKLLAIGHPLANGDKGYYPPAGGLVISPNSGVSSPMGATTFVLWIHKVSGIIERYDVVINDAGEITDVTGITSRGITSRGITSRNISKRGLG